MLIGPGPATAAFARGYSRRACPVTTLKRRRHFGLQRRQISVCFRFQVFPLGDTFDSTRRVGAVARTSNEISNTFVDAFLDQGAKVMLSINQVADPIQIAFAQVLVREYFSWFFALVPGSETDPTFRGWENELEAIPGACVPPRGSYLLATVNGQPAGCVTLKPVDPEHCELKRLYVRPAFRGHNVGKQLVDAFMQSARGLGYKYAVLDSHSSMATAHDIYRNSGFNIVAAPPDFPEDLKHSVIFMRCVL